MDFLHDQHPVEELAEALGVSRSGFYAQRQKAQRPRRCADAEIGNVLEALFAGSRQTYGSPRLRHALRGEGVSCGKNRINRLMRERGLRPRQKRRFKPRTTRSDPTLRVAENWLAKVPTPDHPNQIWVADITYLPTAEGWLYLAIELDACSRRVTGWATREDLSTPLVSEAWERAVFATLPDPGLLHHSDRGSQYASSDFRSLLQTAGACASMSQRGNPYDNALAESFFATLKTECFAGYVPKTRAEARLMLFDFIDGFYNTRRLHSSLGYRSPIEFELSRQTNHKSQT
jgi:putative transposase